MATEENLKEAFAGESQANRKYLAFAEKAEKEGYPQVAKLFRAAAQAETVHALRHLRTLGEVKSTADNLKAAIEGESYELERMYPKFIEEAEKKENTAAVYSLKGAYEAEKVHHKLYQKALEELGRNEPVDYYVCSVCGYTTEKEAPDVCPVCGALKEKFDKIG